MACFTQGISTFLYQIPGCRGLLDCWISPSSEVIHISESGERKRASVSRRVTQGLASATLYITSRLNYPSFEISQIAIDSAKHLSWMNNPQSSGLLPACFSRNPWANSNSTSKFAQELLSTFSTSLGEVALQPSTGGTFTIHLYHLPTDANVPGDISLDTNVEKLPLKVQKSLLWDRKTEGGFPETKELKRRVRDIIDPARNLGHVDRVHNTTTSTPPTQTSDSQESQHQQQQQQLKLSNSFDSKTGANLYAPPRTVVEVGPGQANPGIERTSYGEAIMAGVPIPGPISHQATPEEGMSEGPAKKRRLGQIEDTETGGSGGVEKRQKVEEGGEGVCKPGDECWEG
ncbi:hypothetical protein BP6252_07842 [Coleophoma cylindrospora]|uniref:Uncharacterized protein n=1 Tax=Coleophoma cylindrospora TaxID=1849047 RepID=A0A3D8RB47_9HELO|nr:hypothetical protein BP6252_07842 [Coleophoma cylindrospora]